MMRSIFGLLGERMSAEADPAPMGQHQLYNAGSEGRADGDVDTGGQGGDNVSEVWYLYGTVHKNNTKMKNQTILIILRVADWR